MKKRLDQLLVEKGLVVSRERAKAIILSGNVLVNDEPKTKAGDLIDEDASIRLREADHPYVSRGALKLKAAIENFGVDIQDRKALDVGASTGGFTQVLLEKGASVVHAVDVGHNQLDWKIRSDKRVKVYEKVNAKNMEYALIGETMGVIVVDVSFISIKKILQSLLSFVDKDTDIITLIKPQFEVQKEEVGKGGIVRSEEARTRVVQEITDFFRESGLQRLGLMVSPITGTDGNVEFLTHWKMENGND